MEKKITTGDEPKTLPGETVINPENPPPGLFDGPDYEDPEIMELLAEDEPDPEDEEGIFDEVVLEAEKAGSEDYVPEEDHKANPYRDIFLTPADDEKPLEEIIRDSESLELGADNLGEDMTTPPGGFTGGLSGEEATGTGSTLGWIGAGAAVAAGAGAAAILAGKLKEKKGAAARQQEVYWHYYYNGSQAGPVAEAELKAWLAAGRLPADTYVWREGLAEWVTADKAGLLPAPGGTTPAPEREESGESPARTGKTVERPVWYYHLNGQTLGPVPEEEIRNWLKSGQIDSGTYLWKEGLDGWITVAFAGLADHAPGEEERVGGDVCPACSKPVNRGAKFCPACGGKLLGESAVSAKRQCFRCQAELPQNTEFCTACGTPVGNDTIPKPQQLCQKCGRPLRPGARFCNGCGTSVTKS